MGVFDGIADIITDIFCDSPVIYTPIATGIPVTINAIWWEMTLLIAPGVTDDVSVDMARTQLTVRAVDIPNPQEGDTAKRVSDGKVMEVTTPILPDGKGLIACNLAPRACDE